MGSDKTKAASAGAETPEAKQLRREQKAREKAEKKEQKKASKKEDPEAAALKKRSSATDGGVRKEKKDRKKDKARHDQLARAVDAHLQKEIAVSAAAEGDDDDDDSDADVEANGAEDANKMDVDPDVLVKVTQELVPFALPLADDKMQKKLFKLIKKGAKLKALHRGVKECEKVIKKTPVKKLSSAPQDASAATGLVVIAGDISPMDVIMHFPILCEEHGLPYLFVRSRADLGVAACTKRSTSIVIVRAEGRGAGKAAASGKKAEKNKDEGADDAEGGKVNAQEFRETWEALVKKAQKEWDVQVEPWVKGVHPKQVAARVNGAIA